MFAADTIYINLVTVTYFYKFLQIYLSSLTYGLECVLDICSADIYIYGLVLDICMI